MSMPDIALCKATEVVARVLEQAETGTPFAAVISLEHPGAENPERGRAPRLGESLGGDWKHRQLILSMWDVEQPRPQAPTESHVRAALAHYDIFAPPGSSAPILVHCRQRKARSTALALALLRHRAGAGSEAACLTEILRLAPDAAPNLLLVQMADNVIGCGGRLVAVVGNHPEITERRLRAEARRAEQIASGTFFDVEKLAGLPQPPAQRTISPTAPRNDNS